MKAHSEEEPDPLEQEDGCIALQEIALAFPGSVRVILRHSALFWTHFHSLNRRKAIMYKRKSNQELATS